MMQYTGEQIKALKKAKLLGRGFVYVKSIEDDRRLYNRSASNVLEMTGRPRVDYTQLRSNSTQPVMLPGGMVAGDWKRGLVKEEIELIKSCGVPEISETTNIPYYDGLTFDLSIPSQVANFNVLLATNAVAPSEDELGSRRFYFVKSLDKKKTINRKKENLREALNIENNISAKYKRMLFEIINHNYDEQYASDEMSDDEIASVFGEWVLEDDYAKTIVEKANHNETVVKAEAALCRGFNKGVFAYDTEGRITRSIQGAAPVVYAESYDEALLFLTRDVKEVDKINLLTAETKMIFKEDTVTSTQFDDMYIQDEYDFTDIDFFSIGEFERNGLLALASELNEGLYLEDKDDDRVLYLVRKEYLSRFTKAELLEMFKKYNGQGDESIKTPHINTSHRKMVDNLHILLKSIDKQKSLVENNEDSL